MEEPIMEVDNPEGDNPECKECPACKARVEQMKAEEDRNFAVLVALVPVMIFTFISTAGML